MLQRRTVACIALAVAVAGCRHPASPGSWKTRFGPAITSEVIVGHLVTGGSAWILTDGDALVHIDLEGERYTRNVLRPLAPGEHPWGLASVAGGGMWTLLGRTLLAELSGDGRILRRVNLTQPHMGVFGGGRHLLYQVVSFQPPADALLAGPPGEDGRRPWGAMKTRALPLARTAVAALNLVSCGSTAGRSVPCWFPDLAEVTLTDSTGSSRTLALEGLPLVAPEVLLASDNPQRPVRDALISASNDLWVLGSGRAPSAGSPDRRGGWLLAKYSENGKLMRRIQLPEPARLLLSVSDDRCLLLAWNGSVVEVRP